MFEHLFAFKVPNTANIIQINQQCYSKCSKCPSSAFTQARRRLLKSAIDLQIASCGNYSPRSSQALTSVPGFPPAADSSDRSSVASTPKHDSQADSCPGLVASIFVNKVWTVSCKLLQCWVTFAACAAAPSCWKINCCPSN